MPWESDHDRKLVAYHEAGHAVASYLLKTYRIRNISIIDDDETEGRVRYYKPGRKPHPDYDDSSRTRTKTEKSIMCCLAGDVAVNLLTKRDSPDTDLSDYTKAAYLAGNYCGDPDEVGAYIDFLYYRTRNLLSLPESWSAIKELASVLMERGYIGSKLAYQIMRPYRHSLKATQIPPLVATALECDPRERRK